MDKITFESYKFKPSDVIEGLNRYFAETKAKRYLRASLEIRNGVWTSNPDYRKDVVFTNSPPDRLTRSGHACWNYYLICDPEEVVGVAINWLREEHDIFYTPGMEVPVEAFNEYEKETRKDLKEALQRRLHEAKKRIVALEKGIDQQKARIKELEQSIAEKDSHIEAMKADRWLTERVVGEQRDFITKAAEILEVKDPYIEREYKAAIDALSNIVRYPNRYRWLYTSLKDGMASVLQDAVNRED